MRTLFLAFLLVLIAAAADASCLKCDQSTGYWCFSSIYGTKAHCDSPTSAGCFTWGACTPSNGDCTDPGGCIRYPVAMRNREDLQLASVSITTPLPKRRS